MLRFLADDRDQRSRTAGLTVSDPGGVYHAHRLGSSHLDAKKPKLLCAPVDKNGEDPTAPQDAGHLVCYQIRQVDAVQFAKRTALFVNDQLGPLALDAKKLALLCVRATVAP